MIIPEKRGRYEVGIFEEGKRHPLKIFKTDVEDAITTLEAEAYNYIKYLQRQDPDKRYHVKKLERLDGGVFAF